MPLEDLLNRYGVAASRQRRGLNSLLRSYGILVPEEQDDPRGLPTEQIDEVVGLAPQGAGVGEALRRMAAGVVPSAKEGLAQMVELGLPYHARPLLGLDPVEEARAGIAQEFERSQDEILGSINNPYLAAGGAGLSNLAGEGLIELATGGVGGAAALGGRALRNVAEEAAPKIAPEAARALAGLLPVNVPQRAVPQVVEDVAQVGERLMGEAAPKAPFQYNLGSIDLDEDGQRMFLEVVRENADPIALQRRAGTGWEGLGAPEELAAKLGMSTKQLMQTPAGTAFNQEEMAVLNSALGGAAKRVAGLRDAINAGQDSTATKAALAQAVDEFTALSRVSIGAGSEAGRALNSRKAFIASMDADVAERLNLMKKYAGKLSDEQIGSLALIDPNNPEELFGWLRSVDKPKMGDYVFEYFLSNILSGHRPHMVNAISNTAFRVVDDLAVRPVKALLDAPLSKLSGRERQAYMSEVLPAAVGSIKGLPSGFASGLKIMLRGWDATDASGKLLPPRSSFDRSSNAFVRKVLSPVVTWPLRALSASDAVFRSMATSAELHAQAARRATKAGLEGEEWAAEVARLIANPDSKMVKAAEQYGRFATFTDKPSPFGKAFGDMVKAVPGGRYVQPFINVVDRLFARGFEFTPAGLVRAANKQNAERQSDLAARGAIGSAAMLATVFYSLDGKVTGAAPRDSRKRELFYESGKQPYSVLIGDQWVPIGAVEPMSTMFQLTADAMDAWQENGELVPEQRIYTALSSAARGQLNKSYITGMLDIVEAIESGGTSAEKVLNVGARQVAGMVPAAGLQRSIATAMDPTLRHKDTMQERIMSGVPGLSDNLPPRIGWDGQPIERVTGSRSGYLPSGTPLLATKAKRDRVLLAFEEAGIAPSTAIRVVDGAELDREQRDEAQVIAGTYARERIERLVKSPDFWLLSREQKAERLQRAMRDGQERARIQMRNKLRSLSR